ncbi:FHA domain-containing protein PS1 [Cardamine amara subsp. amara]|uniref:FHA domain-containing protein PS1 n=1 Tax=Cardamine amara subsp. amara TaxID=228776 RepID=A0ABD1BQH6_CARAN
MEFKEEKLTEEQQVREKMIPVFTVLKNGAILKNIFVVNSRDFSSPERNGSTVSDDNEVEETLVVGRHPDCDILLTHPSISRFHLEIRSIPSLQKLFVTDLSSVHGTWVTDQRVEPHACVEVNEGDVIRIGGSTRIYRLHWIPLSRAYDIENPFVSPLDVSIVMEQEEENRVLDAENLEVAHQSLANTGSGDDGDQHLDETSKGTGSSVPSEDEDSYVTTREMLLPVASPSVLTLARDSIKTQKLQSNEDLQTSPKWDLDVVEAATEKPSSSCSPSKQQSGSYLEGLGCSELEVVVEADECDVRGDGGLHLNVMSERIESAVPNEDDDPYPVAKKTSSLPLPRDSTETEKLQFIEDVQDSPELAISILEAIAENPSSGYSPSKEQIDGFFETSGCSVFELASQVEILSFCREFSAETEFVPKEVMEASNEPLTKTETESLMRGPHLNVMSDRMVSIVSNEDEDSYLAAKETSSLPLPRDSVEAETLWLTEDVQASPELSINSLEANTENPSSGCSPDKGQIDGCFDAFELAAEVEILSLHREVSGETDFVTKQVMEASAEPLTKADIRSHEDNGETEVSRQVIAVSPNSYSQVESPLEILTEVQGLIGSEFQQQKTNGETKVGSGQASAESDCLFAGNERLLRINTEDIQSLCSSWQLLPEGEVRVPSEVKSEVNPVGDQNQKSGMTIETDKIFDEGSSSCLSEDLKQSSIQSFLSTPNQKSNTESSVGPGRSKESYSQSEIEGEENTDKWSPIPSTLAAETFEDTKYNEELPFDGTESQENQTPQTHAGRDGVLSKIDSSSTCNIWSRRGKAASVLQIRTNKSEGKQKQIGNRPKDQLHRKQVLSDKSISLTVHHSAVLEPEIFTPDKENLTPRSHMLKRLHDVGDVKDSKSSSKLSGKSSLSKIHFSSAFATSEAFSEPEIFTPDKENLTPNSHMLKRLREFGDIKETKSSSSKATRKPFFHVEERVMAEQKPDLHSMSSTSKVKKHEPVALKKKAERAPFQPLLEKSSSQSQSSYTEPSSIASARNNISRGIRSSSLLSDGKNKMKWTIVLDTSSLLDKESRKPLHLLQGLKGTHMVLPRTVLRELNEVKRARSLLFRRRTEIASSALDWIEECKVNTKWWIQVQSPSEETKAIAPTPPVTPQSNDSATFPFSFHWSNNAPEIDSPTSVDQVLECALLYRNRNRDEKLVLLSNDVTLKIKAMAEGVICETAHEFYESLVNPFSERFMWTESAARGRTWSHLDDVVLRERYNYRACGKKSTYNGGGRGENGAAAKGLKLILLHNSHYGHTH